MVDQSYLGFGRNNDTYRYNYSEEEVLVCTSFNSFFSFLSSAISFLSCAFIYKVSMYAIEVVATIMHKVTIVRIHPTRRVVATLATQKSKI